MPQTLTKTDYSTWLTKQQAATAIGCSTKLIEQFAADSKIQQKMYRRPEGGPRIAVYHPVDVAKIAKKRNPDAAPFVISASEDDANEPSMLQAPAPPARIPNEQQYGAAVAALLGKVFSGAGLAVTPTVPIAEKIWLTVAQASEFSGLPQAHLRRLIADEKLPAVKTGSGWRIRRSELEKV